MGGEVENSRGYWLLLAAFSRGLRERGTQAGGRQLARGGGGGGGGWGDGDFVLRRAGLSVCSIKSGLSERPR